MLSPNLSNLSLITYNKDGKEVDVRIIPQLNSAWYDLGLLLRQTQAELDSCKSLAYTGGSKYSCCQRVFSKWLQKGNERYPVTWTGVIKLLMDMERCDLAIALQEAISYNGFNV